MQCANCREEGSPAYTLRAHVESDGESGGRRTNEDARTDGGEPATIDLTFCSLSCLRAWT